jgi:hypothetical protein
MLQDHHNSGRLSMMRTPFGKSGATLAVTADGSKTSQRSGVGFYGEGVAVRVLEPRDATAASSCGDASGLLHDQVTGGHAA